MSPWRTRGNGAASRDRKPGAARWANAETFSAARAGPLQVPTQRRLRCLLFLSLPNESFHYGYPCPATSVPWMWGEQTPSHHTARNHPRPGTGPCVIQRPVPLRRWGLRSWMPPMGGRECPYVEIKAITDTKWPEAQTMADCGLFSKTLLPSSIDRRIWKGRMAAALHPVFPSSLVAKCGHEQVLSMECEQK